jgi:hypothetical protein
MYESGGAAAFGLILTTVGRRPDLRSTAHLEWLAVNLLFALVIGTGAPLLLRPARPGLENATNWALVLFPFFAAIAAAVAMLLLSRPQAWERDASWSEASSARRLLRIMFFPAIPLAASIWALPKGAPIRLKLCGVIAGIVAGDSVLPLTR